MPLEEALFIILFLHFQVLPTHRTPSHPEEAEPALLVPDSNDKQNLNKIFEIILFEGKEGPLETPTFALILHPKRNNQ